MTGIFAKSALFALGCAAAAAALACSPSAAPPTPEPSAAPAPSAEPATSAPSAAPATSAPATQAPQPTAAPEPPAGHVGTHVGDIAPAYALKLPGDGETSSAELVARGKPVFILFHATW